MLKIHDKRIKLTEGLFERIEKEPEDTCLYKRTQNTT
jgi:hypothetical protein